MKWVYRRPTDLRSTSLPVALYPEPAAGTDALQADDVQSTSEVSSVALGQEHALLADDAQSTSEVSSPAIGQEHALLADDVQSLSEVSAPALSEVGGTHNLTAVDIQSTSQVTAPAIAQTHAILADDAQSTSEVGAPALAQEHALLADDVQSTSEVSSPTVSENDFRYGVGTISMIGGMESIGENWCPIRASGSISILGQLAAVESPANDIITAKGWIGRRFLNRSWNIINEDFSVDLRDPSNPLDWISHPWPSAYPYSDIISLDGRGIEGHNELWGANALLDVGTDAFAEIEIYNVASPDPQGVYPTNSLRWWEVSFSFNAWFEDDGDSYDVWVFFGRWDDNRLYVGSAKTVGGNYTDYDPPSAELDGFPTPETFGDGSKLRFEYIGSELKLYLDDELLYERIIYNNKERRGIILWTYNSSNEDYDEDYPPIPSTSPVQMDNLVIGGLVEDYGKYLTARGTVIADNGNLLAYGSITMKGELAEAYLHKVTCLQASGTILWAAATVSAGYTDPNLKLVSGSINFSADLDLSALYARTATFAVSGQLSASGRLLMDGTAALEADLSSVDSAGMIGPGTIDGQRRAIIRLPYGSIELYNNSAGGFYSIGGSQLLKEGYGLVNFAVDMNAIGRVDQVRSALGVITMIGSADGVGTSLASGSIVSSP